jgi:hypothetical protein
VRALAIVALLFVVGCGGAVESTPDQKPPASESVAWVACTSISDTVPNDDCSAGQLIVTRCTAATDNPDPQTCTGPRTSPQQTSGDVWCCE